MRIEIIYRSLIIAFKLGIFRSVSVASPILFLNIYMRWIMVSNSIKQLFNLNKKLITHYSIGKAPSIFNRKKSNSDSLDAIKKSWSLHSPRRIIPTLGRERLKKQGSTFEVWMSNEPSLISISNSISYLM